MILLATGQWSLDHHIEPLLMPGHNSPLIADPVAVQSDASSWSGHLLNKDLQSQQLGLAFASHTMPWSDGRADEGLLQRLSCSSQSRATLCLQMPLYPACAPIHPPRLNPSFCRHHSHTTHACCQASLRRRPSAGRWP